jgi:hypothetical protein
MSERLIKTGAGEASVADIRVAAGGWKVESSIGLLDPSLGTHNVGDQIIAEAVQQELGGLMPAGARILRFTTQRHLFPGMKKLLRLPVAFVGGTNLLSSNMLGYRQWRIGLGRALMTRHQAVLLGVGWWQYQREPNAYTRMILRSGLSQDFLHSARDSYTARRLRRLGLNVVNTSCPTIWCLRDVPEYRPFSNRRVITTLTDYMRDPRADQAFLRLLTDRYDEVIFWPQGKSDRRYLDSLEMKLPILDAGLATLDATLVEGNTDYCGTRLHAGIRALQHGVRTTILAVDNRASEMGRDVGLPVGLRSDIRAIGQLLGRDAPVRLSIPRTEINEWRDSTRSQLHRLLSGPGY